MFDQNVDLITFPENSGSINLFFFLRSRRAMSGSGTKMDICEGVFREFRRNVPKEIFSAKGRRRAKSKEPHLLEAGAIDNYISCQTELLETLSELFESHCTDPDRRHKTRSEEPGSHWNRCFTTDPESPEDLSINIDRESLGKRLYGRDRTRFAHFSINRLRQSTA